MKFAFDRKKYASIIMIFLMVGSTVAYSVLQAIRSWQEPEEEVVELPESNIVDYEITAEQRNYMLKNGKVVIEYRYKLSCSECTNQRAYIESTVNTYPNQLFVQEIVDNTVETSRLTISSAYGSDTLTNPTNDEIFDVLCELMIDPPIACATRNI